MISFAIQPWRVGAAAAIDQTADSFLKNTCCTVDKLVISSEETRDTMEFLREEIMVLTEADESMSVSFGGYAVFGRHFVDEDDLRGELNFGCVDRIGEVNFSSREATHLIR